jgi:ketosteroid isomerase-like protein
MRRRTWIGVCAAVAIAGSLGLGGLRADDTGAHAAMDAFHAAASEADFDAYFALMHDDGVFLGTDATERWTKAQFMEYARPFMVEQGKGWTYHPRDRRVSVRGDVAWFDELIENEKYGTLRGQGVLVREGGAWKVAQYSYSFAVPNEKAPGVVALILGQDEDGAAEP